MDKKTISDNKESIDERFEEIKKKLNLKDIPTKERKEKIEKQKEEEKEQKAETIEETPLQTSEIEERKEEVKISEETEEVPLEEQSEEQNLGESDSQDKIADTEQQFVIFNLEREEFAINIQEVFEITKLKEMTRVPNTPDYIKGVINLRGRIHSVIDLSKKLNLSAKKEDADSRIIIVETKEDNIGVLVDSVKEVLKVSKGNIKDVPNMFNSKINADFISNVLILGERLIILLNLSNILGVEEVDALRYAKDLAGN